MDIYSVVIVVYIAAIFGISFWRSRGVQTQEEFMVAGRSSPAWLLVGSLICTWIGAGSLIAGGGRSFREGFSQLWMSGGAWIAIVIVFFLADRVRRISKYTIQDILEERYHPAARIFGAIAVILGSVIIFSYQLKGIAFVVEYLYKIPQVWGIIGMAFLVVLFTTSSGLRSILAMDILNGALIILAIIIGLPLMLSTVGGGDIGAGIQHVATTLPAKHFTMFGTNDFIWAFGVFFPTFFLLLGESSMYQKFFSAKDGAAAKKAVVGFLIGVVFLEIALTAFAVTSSSHPDMAVWRESQNEFVAAAENSASKVELDAKWKTLMETVVPVEAERKARPADNGEAITKAQELYKGRTDSINLVAAFKLPVWAGALFLAAAMAIVFSTANSFMLASSTAFVRDIWQRFLRPAASPAEIIWVQRITIVVFAAMAVSILTVFTTVWEMSLAAYTIIGVTITPVLLAAFLWKRVTPAGGIASMAAGVFGWIIFVALKMNGIIELDYDFIIYFVGGASIFALVAVSLVTKPSPPGKIALFMSDAPVADAASGQPAALDEEKSE